MWEWAGLIVLAFFVWWAASVRSNLAAMRKESEVQTELMRLTYEATEDR